MIFAQEGHDERMRESSGETTEISLPPH